ncbi:MAG: ATP-binding protein [Candidatus Muirbacterium halophilum]|nr:ATP-binding protein [Candidatus Muirbacterium halophilum]
MSKKIEDKYKVLDHLEHVLHRPASYLGSNQPNTSNKYVLENGKMVLKKVTIIPSFLKIFDEIITNSVDEGKRKESKLNIIKVTIKNNKITIWDNGGIEVVIHKEYNKYVPEIIFGTLMSGSNYDDDDERIVAGTNGYGSKISNIFSKEFKISTCDGINQFTQVFANNMHKRSKPVIKANNKNHTEISYIPDYERFGLVGIDDDHFKMIEKRVYDLAACNTKLKIYFNGKLINFKSFEDYINCYVDNCFYETKKDKSWSIGIALSNNGFQQVSFANSTDTYDGGTHVDYVLNQIIVQMRDFFQKKHKIDIKPSELKNHMFLFLNSTIVNPSFSSQTKEKLITEIKDFGNTFEISNKLVNSILKSEIVNSILDWVQQKKTADDSKLQRDLNKKLSKIKVEKLIDAKGKNRSACSLGLYEGDCLHEDTNIRVIREGDIVDIPIKKVNTDDLVITHNNRISNIYALSKKIKYKSIIKIKDDEIICSKEHKWFIYDVVMNKFYFEKTKNIDKHKHKLVKNYLAFTSALLIIDSIDLYNIKLSSGEMIVTNPEHKFAIYDKENNIFELKSTSEIDPNIHFLVNTFKL